VLLAAHFGEIGRVQQRGIAQANVKTKSRVIVTRNFGQSPINVRLSYRIIPV
jgi:hypothetical protein